MANCEHCGTAYEPATTWQRFCTANCRKRYHDKRAKRRDAEKLVKEMLAELQGDE